MGWNRLRGNFLSGQIADAPLLVGATTLTSPGLASLPVIANGDYMVLVIDPSGTGGPPEIVYVTAHASLGETATILRAQEGSGAREHAATTTWINSPTTYDFRGINNDRVWNKGSAANPLDDEFADGVLDPAWIRVDAAGASGHLTWTEAADAISGYHAGTDAASAFHALLKPFGSNFAIGNQVETCISFMGQRVSSPMAGLMLTDGVTHGAGVQISAMFWHSTTDYASASLRRTTSFTTDNNPGTQINLGAQAGRFRMHMRLKWVAANSFSYWVSSDGVVWYPINLNAAYTCTPTHLGVAMSTWASTQDMIWTFDYVRVT